MLNVEATLKASAERTEAALAACLVCDKEDLAPIFEAEGYSLLGGGKRIRPFLVLEFCKLFGGREEAAMPFACALEMIHTYSLIHDDLPCMDDDDYRRGRLTSHKRFGEAMAVLAGDALLTRAFGTAASNAKVSAEICLAAVKTLSDAAGDEGMIGGQVLDILGENDPTITLEDLRRLQSLKTGALIRAAARLGCLAAGKTVDSPEATAADQYAMGIGLAFQIVDDVLDVVGDPSLLGKQTGADTKKHKMTFTHFYSPDEAMAYARTLTDRSIAALAPYGEAELLCELARYLSERKY